MKPDLKVIRKKAEKEARPFTDFQLSPFYDGPRRGDDRGRAMETLSLLDYIGRLKEKLVDERRDRLSIEVLYYLITKEWPVPIYYHLLDEQAHDEIRQELSELTEETKPEIEFVDCENAGAPCPIHEHPIGLTMPAGKCPNIPIDEAGKAEHREYERDVRNWGEI